MKNNQKRILNLCIIIGLAAIAIICIIPTISNYIYERERFIAPQSTNIFEFDFNDHWKQVAAALKLDEAAVSTSKIENFHIDYKKEGKIKRITYQLVWKEENKLRYASVYFCEESKSIRIEAEKISEWAQYDKMISTDKLFDILDKINMKELTPKENLPYYALQSGEQADFGISKERNEGVFIIDGSKVVPFSGENSVNCNYLYIYGMDKSGKNSYSSTTGNYYLFDIL